MKIICAWRNEDMGAKDGKGVEGVTHSICRECLAMLGTKCPLGLDCYPSCFWWKDGIMNITQVGKTGN